MLTAFQASITYMAYNSDTVIILVSMRQQCGSNLASV